jgi:hypothetical protein
MRLLEEDQNSTSKLIPLFKTLMETNMPLFLLMTVNLESELLVKNKEHQKKFKKMNSKSTNNWE